MDARAVAEAKREARLLELAQQSEVISESPAHALRGGIITLDPMDSTLFLGRPYSQAAREKALPGILRVNDLAWSLTMEDMRTQKQRLADEALLA